MKRDWLQLLFSFEGRIPRSAYWWGLGAMVASFGLVALFAAAINAVFGWLALESVGRPLFVMLVGAATIAALWAWFALGVKRFHDHDLSGWWMIAGRIPIIGPIGLFIVLGLSRGTIGPNRFGEDVTLGDVYAQQYA